MHSKWTRTLMLVLVLCLLSTLVVGCAKKKASEKVTIVIGDLTDFTGPSSAALKPISWALEDYANYINEQNAIPGVELKVIQFDTKYEAARISTGYEWLREQGAKVIFTAPPFFGETLKARAAADQFPILCCTPTETILADPGYLFTLNCLDSKRTTAVLKWISENDWDYSKGVPKIGLVGYAMSPNTDQASAMQAYCQAHPDKFNLVGTSLVPYGTMAWATEVEKYKDCDYLQLGPVGAVMPTTFIQQYRSAGYKAKFVGSDALASYFGTILGKTGWDAIDGTLSFHTWGWWTYDCDEMRLLRQLLFDNHPDEAYSVMRAGAGGMGGIQAHFFIQMVKAVIEQVGAENFSGQAFYDTVQTVTVSLPGYNEVTYANNNREGGRYIQIWEWSAAKQDMVMASDGWIDCWQ